MGETWRDAAAIGVLMNTRGLTELVILTVGLEIGVINSELFTMGVLMALVTTLMATPVLALISPLYHRGMTAESSEREPSDDGSGPFVAVPEPIEIDAIADDGNAASSELVDRGGHSV